MSTFACRWVFLVALGVLATTASRAHAAAAPAGGENLGDSLLGRDLNELLGSAVDEPAPLAEPAGEQPAPAGEDVRRNPLESIEGHMQDAEAKLRQRDPRQTAQPAQRQVIAELDALIEKMEKQCQGGSGQCKPNQKPSTASQRSQPKPSAGQAQGKKPGASRAKSVTSNDSQANVAGTDAETAQARESLRKDVWGALPARLREQMLQSSADDFLPKYRSEIEAYYQRLSEEPDDE